MYQLKRADSRARWINNPQPEAAPRREDFCWYIPRDAEGPPYRPRALQDAGIDLARCRVSSLEHAPGIYRLYRYEDCTEGVFRNGVLTCTSIPREDEDSRCIGLLVFNQTAYDAATRDHKHYWEWRRSRDERRWQGEGEVFLDYDAKNMMHTFRVLLVAEGIVDEGAPRVRICGEDLKRLHVIREGTLPLEGLVREAEGRIQTLRERASAIAFPAAIGAAAASALIRDITEFWEAHGGT